MRVALEDVFANCLFVKISWTIVDSIGFPIHVEIGCTIIVPIPVGLLAHGLPLVSVLAAVHLDLTTNSLQDLMDVVVELLCSEGIQAQI